MAIGGWIVKIYDGPDAPPDGQYMALATDEPRRTPERDKAFPWADKAQAEEWVRVFNDPWMGSRAELEFHEGLVGQPPVKP